MTRAKESGRPRGVHAERVAADAELVRRCLAGDTQAWADIYLLYRTPLYALIRSWTGDHALAEDVLHDAFVRAFEQMKTFDARRPFFRWIASIARNLLFDAHRKWRQHSPLENQPAASTSIDTTVESVLADEQRATVRSALRRLPKTQFDAVLLADVEQLTYRQVAASVGTSESAAKSLVFRARTVLRRSLRSLVGVAWVTSVRARLRQAASRLGPLGQLVQGDVGTASLVAVAGLALVFGGAILPAIGPAEAAPASLMRPPAHRISDSKGGAIRPAHNAGDGRPSNTQAISASFDHRSPHHGAVVPPNGDLRIQVVAPDGRVIYDGKTDYRCDGQGAELLPSTGPVRAAC